MRFSVEWIDGGMNRAAEERATLCKLGIYIQGQNACRFIDYVSNEETESLVVPAVHLAEGLATDWWIIFGGRDRDHGIRRYRTGFALPDLRFRNDGSTFEVTGKDFHSDNPHLDFRSDGAETLPRSAAESELSRFIQEVVDRLAGEGVRNSEVAVCWSRVGESRNDPDEQPFCEAAGALGLDPYAISDDDACFIEQANDIFSEESLIEFLAGIRKAERSASVLERVRQMESRPAEAVRLPELGDVAIQVEGLTGHAQVDRPWTAGYRAARACRQALNLRSDYRFPSYMTLARKLGAAQFEPAQLFDGVRALVSCPDGDIRVHLHDHGRDRRPADIAEWSNNFAFARAVGDAVCFRNTPRSVVNDLHRAERQATGRAFAAEFLAPVESVVEMLDDDRGEKEIADEFSVSSSVIKNQIRNRANIEAYGKLRAARPDDAITAAELLSRFERGPAPFTAAELKAIDRSKAEQRAPEDKWNDR